MTHFDFDLKNDIIESMLHSFRKIKDKEENWNITEHFIENDDLYALPFRKKK